LLLRGERLELYVGVGHLEDERTGVDLGAGPHVDLFDAPTGGGRDELDLLRDESSGAAHLDYHLALAHRVDPERGPVDSGRRRLEPAERCGDDHDSHDGDRAQHVALFLARWLARDIQADPSPVRTLWRASSPLAPIPKGIPMPPRAPVKSLPPSML